MTTILENKTVKIRKEHSCFFCWRKFPKGTVMRYQKILCDGQFNESYSCRNCDALIKTGNIPLSDDRDSEDDMYAEGGTLQTMAEMGCSTPEELYMNLGRR